MRVPVLRMPVPVLGHCPVLGQWASGHGILLGRLQSTIPHIRSTLISIVGLFHSQTAVLQVFSHTLSHVFQLRRGPLWPDTGMFWMLFIYPEDRVTWTYHLRRHSRTIILRSHRPSLACRIPISVLSDGLTRHIQRIIARSLGSRRCNTLTVMGQVSETCIIELQIKE